MEVSNSHDLISLRDVKVSSVISKLNTYPETRLIMVSHSHPYLFRKSDLLRLSQMYEN